MMHSQQSALRLRLPRYVFAATALCLFSAAAFAQTTDTTAAPAPAATAPAATTTQTTNAKPAKKTRESRADKKADKTVASKDTQKLLKSKKAKQLNQLAGLDTSLPDKELYDKSLLAEKKGRFDVARMDLQTLLNTYPDSQFQMRAKLAIADSWFKEGGSAALAQAEAEYKDFQTFFPNVPEAAEAQMRVADIYYRQMDKPDRDYGKTKHAEDEYRTMILQYPDSTLIPEAKQKLREVQEVLATREALIAAYYAQQENWPAAIARYQTLVDTYPLYSHSDDALIALGDAYAGQAHRFENSKLPEDIKSRIMKSYNDLAAASYSLLITRYPSMDRVDDARDRLQALHYPVPTPTREAIAESQTLTDSRKAITLSDRAKILLLRRPDTFEAARVGEPTMVSPPDTTAPAVIKQMTLAFNNAVNPGAVQTAPAKTTPVNNNSTPATTDTAAPAPAPAPAGDAPLQLQDVNTTTGSVPTGTSITNVQSGTTVTSVPAGGRPSTGVGLGIVGSSPADNADTTPDPNGGLKAVGPKDNTPLPAVEKAAPAPETTNDVAGVATPPAAAKNSKPNEDKKTESSTKKKKKGLKKLIP